MFFKRRRRIAELSGMEWRQRAVPAACAGVQTMLLPDELRLLDFLADTYYEGRGVIVDAGCFVGGSTVALAAALRRNLARRRRREQHLIHSYDIFAIEEWTRGIFFPETAQAGDSFRPIFDRNIADFADLVAVHPGNITAAPWIGAPIEILFVDVAKHWTVCDWLSANFFRHLIPGRSIVIQQDYLYHHWNAWIHVTMEYYRDHFEMLFDTTYNSVVFLHTKKFGRRAIQPKTVASLSDAEKATLMDRAAARFSGEQRHMLVAAKEHFLGMLAAEREPGFR
jgi:hypothetical protein